MFFAPGYIACYYGYWFSFRGSSFIVGVTEKVAPTITAITNKSNYSLMQRTGKPHHLSWLLIELLNDSKTRVFPYAEPACVLLQ